MVSAVDTECYIDYWLCKFSTGESFVLLHDHPLNITGLLKALSRYTIVTFNGIGYDMPIISLALGGVNNEQLKRASDQIIVDGVPYWDIAPRLNWVDHIDMMNVAPGAGGLKAYGGKMHMPKLQDLPITPDASIKWYQRLPMAEYCQNDLNTTAELHARFKSQLQLRVDMSAQYGIDLRSKSDAQIAEAVMKSLLDFKPVIPRFAEGCEFYYKPPAWISFVNLPLLELLARCPFTIGESGAPIMAEELAKTTITIGNSRYKMGSGGLHSTETGASHVTDDTYVLRDHDVASYYPSIVLACEISPPQLGDSFLSIYKGWRDRRIVAKRAKDKKTADSLKTLLNGTFGKLGSRFSIFYAPSELIQVTITGQLALLMLIERLELSGISVISANTDGIVLKCPRAHEWLADTIIAEWERITSFETERTDYTAVYSRDVNSYIAVSPDGTVKRKGVFAEPLPGPSGWPNPTGEICVTAIVAYLTKGVPLIETVRACTDIKQFVYVRSVKGGGEYVSAEILPKKASQRFKRQFAGTVEAYDLIASLPVDSEYLGKTVRWYYAQGSTGSIRYKSNGNLVPTTIGCKPCMELPSKFPDDIDYNRYVLDAEELLKSCGIS